MARNILTRKIGIGTLARAALMAGLVLSLSGCALFRWIFGTDTEVAEEIVRMSDEEVDATLEEWGGRRLDKGGWEIGDYYVRETAWDDGSITIYRKRENWCQKTGWTQVIRESLDGEIVRDPTKLPEPANLPGIRRWSRGKVTAGGWVVDGNPNSKEINYSDKQDETFTDKPAMPTSELEANTQKPNARLYKLEAETCRRCLQPLTPFGPCFKWYYVRIIDPQGKANRSYMVTKETPEAAPSSDFNDAIQLWQQ